MVEQDLPLCPLCATRSRAGEDAGELHPITTSSCLAFGGRARKDSSRLYSRMRAIASRRFARHSSPDFPWPLAPGASVQYAMCHGPSRSTIAVELVAHESIAAASGL